MPRRKIVSASVLSTDVPAERDTDSQLVSPDFLKRNCSVASVRPTKGTHRIESLSDVVSVRRNSIVRFHGYYEDPEDFLLVLDVAPLGDLSRWMTHMNDRHRATTALLAGSSIADALSYLHGSGIAHRDLKPSNILVFRSDTFRLCDFGCACMGDLTRTTLCGTPEFMAPELLVRNRRYDAARADSWSLGVLMYDLIYGATPFRSNKMEEVFLKIANFNGPPEMPETSAIDAATRNSLVAICEGLLKKTPSQRMGPERAMQHLQHPGLHAFSS
jgi:serine/threonine protein kinase